MKKLTAALLIATSGLAATAANASDVGYGLGVTWVFGSGENSGLAIGPKVFSTNEEDKVAASIGIDYVLKSASFRPNVGVSYLFKEDVYTDLNVGYNLKAKAVDFGFAVGYTETKEDKKSTKAAQETGDKDTVDTDTDTDTDTGTGTGTDTDTGE
jgi:hypothetical protein